MTKNYKICAGILGISACCSLVYIVINELMGDGKDTKPNNTNIYNISYHFCKK